MNFYPRTTSEARRPRLAKALLGTLLAALTATLIVACGGGGSVQAPTTRALPDDFSARKAVAYSPYRTARSEPERASETITAAMVKQDLDLLLAGGFRLIRLFDSSDKVARLTLQVIRDNGLDIKVMLGVYPAAFDGAFSNAEIARGIALANTFKNEVVAVSVGNETMVSWSFNPLSTAAMRTYITAVRAAITQPVTTDDNWAFFARGGPFEQDPAQILASIDFVAMHTYALLDTVFNPGLWDWRQASVPAASRAQAMMDAALAATKKDYAAVRTHMDSLGFTTMPIVIGETGWKADPSFHLGRSGAVNQKMYFDALAAWRATPTGPKNIFWFEGFDEPWKQGDDGWGLFNVQRKARCVVQGLYAATLWDTSLSCSPSSASYVVPLNVRPAITATRYTPYAETLTAGEARPVLATWWNAWENDSTAVAVESTTTASPTDASKSIEITPRPAVWGWGETLPLPNNTADNLTAFANGTLNFSIKTTYPGKLEVGFYIGSGTDGSAYDVYIPIGAGDYGYVNDGNWRQVSIPINELINKVLTADRVAASRIDLGRVTNTFVIADRYAVTGKAAGANVTTKIYVDAIYWAR